MCRSNSPQRGPKIPQVAYARLVHWLERLSYKKDVRGPIPRLGTGGWQSGQMRVPAKDVTERFVGSNPTPPAGGEMLLLLLIVLILWMVGFGFSIAGGFIHLLLVVALILLILTLLGVRE